MLVSSNIVHLVPSYTLALLTPSPQQHHSQSPPALEKFVHCHSPLVAGLLISNIGVVCLFVSNLMKPSSLTANRQLFVYVVGAYDNRRTKGGLVFVSHHSNYYIKHNPFAVAGQTLSGRSYLIQVHIYSAYLPKGLGHSIRQQGRV